MCVKSGYKTLTPIVLANCLGALQRKEISQRTVRVFFACVSTLAVREAAGRTARKKGRQECKSPRYSRAELKTLTGLSECAIKRELRVLRRQALLLYEPSRITVNQGLLPGNESLCSWLSGKRTPKRPIPVPRAVLRFLARSKRRALSQTMVAYVARGAVLDMRTREVRGAGTVKSSAIAKAFKLSLRSVKASRKELINEGFITKDTASFQRKLNRDGAYFRLNLDWSDRRQFAPHAHRNRVVFAPPYKYNKTSYEFKNQKAQGGVPKMPGVCKANKSGEETEPNLKNVRREDLKSYPRLRILFEQAVRAAWIRNSEADFLNWVAAAVRANTVPARDPVRVFVAIVRRHRWELITQAQEDRARAAIRHYRERENVPRVSRND